MAEPALDDVFVDDITLPAMDGYPLAATLFLPRGAKRHAVLINSATAVHRKIYRGFAGYLAKRGCAVLTYDYRGTGDSRQKSLTGYNQPKSLVGFKASMSDWAAQDVTAAVSWMRERYKALPFAYVGHSFGGQALGLLQTTARFLPAIALLHAAGAATVMVFIRHAFSGDFGFDLLGAAHDHRGLSAAALGPRAHARRHGASARSLRWPGCGTRAALRPGIGARRGLGRMGRRWCRWSSCSRPWLAFGNLDRDLVHAAVALALAVGFVLAGKLSRGPKRRRCPAVPPSPSCWPAPALPCCSALHMAFSAGWTTVLLGAALALPAFATRYRSYPVLGWLSAAGAAFVLFRFAIDPSIVGFAALSTDAGVQLAAAGLRRSGAGCRVCRLAARPHHWRPAAAGDGSGGIVLRADRRSDAGPPRHEWRRPRCGFADARRAGDLHADRARRQRHPDRAGHALAEPGLPHRLDDRRPAFGRRWWLSSTSCCSTCSSPTN